MSSAVSQTGRFQKSLVYGFGSATITIPGKTVRSITGEKAMR
jgi:hypothetical protein